jgi:hypothetical protein
MLTGGPPPVQVPVSTQAKTSKAVSELDKVVDPNVHAALLTSLNVAAGESEDHGRNFQKILADELEIAIKELSSCLLYPDSPRSELDACIKRFESALDHMKTTQQSLEHSIARLQQIETQFPGH